MDLGLRVFSSPEVDALVPGCEGITGSGTVGSFGALETCCGRLNWLDGSTFETAGILEAVDLD